MDATERLPHFDAEALGDVVSGHPSTCSVAESGGHVGGVWFRADHDDPVARISASSISTATRKGRAVDDHEVGCELVYRCWKFLVEEACAPATVFALEKLKSHPLHGRVGDSYEDQRDVVAHWASVAVHDLIISR